MGDESGAASAARVLASRRARVRSICASCGQAIEGTTRRKYCSNRCAARESRRRKRAAEAVPDVVVRLDRVRERIMHGRRFEDDSTDILRQLREERSQAL